MQGKCGIGHAWHGHEMALECLNCSFARVSAVGLVGSHIGFVLCEPSMLPRLCYPVVVV